MGKVVSTQEGNTDADRWAEQRQQPQVRVATVAETHDDMEGSIPVATTVQQETNSVETPYPRNSGRVSSIRSGVSSAASVRNAPTRTGVTGNSESCSNDLSKWFFRGFIVLFVMLGISAFIFTTNVETEAPTASPTTGPPGPVDVFNCPAVFDFGNQNVSLSSCSTNGCGGSITWCGLDNARSYRLTVAVRGDYSFFTETVTITYAGFQQSGSAGSECGSSFVQIFDQTALPTGGTLVMSYQNSGAVSAICAGGTLASEVLATLIEL